MARLSAFPRFFALAASLLLALCAGNAFAQAAYVHDMTGTATATTGAGAATAQRALKTGDLVESGTTISTGAKSSAVIKFEDGQIMALAESTSFRIVDYRYNKQRVAQSSAVFNLIQGGLRFVSGVIGSTNRNNFRMTAGTATIGIRGSIGDLQYNAVTQAVLVAVRQGALTLASPQGQAALNLGQFSSLAPGQAPTQPAAIAQAGPAVAAAFNQLAIATAILPTNMPVVLQASAAAAAAAATAVALQNQANAPGATDAQKAAAAAATALAQTSLAAAIAAAEAAFTAAQGAGAVAPAPVVLPPELQQGVGTTAPSITVDGVTITPTPAGSGGSGGGGGGGPASGS